ncbi:hypothetical protein ES703_56716 [subsurface metagenome]
MNLARAVAQVEESNLTEGAVRHNAPGKIDHRRLNLTLLLLAEQVKCLLCGVGAAVAVGVGFYAPRAYSLQLFLPLLDYLV